MSTLKTNYKDDILDTSVNTQRKYRMVNNADGTISLEDVTVYTQNGDTFGASEVNQIHAAVNLVNESLTVDTTNLSEDYSLNALLQLLAEKYFSNGYIYNEGNINTDIAPLQLYNANNTDNGLYSTTQFGGVYCQKVDSKYTKAIIVAKTSSGGHLQWGTMTETASLPTVASSATGRVSVYSEYGTTDYTTYTISLDASGFYFAQTLTDKELYIKSIKLE